MDNSDFFPEACSTVNRKKNKNRPPSIQSYFEENDSLCSIRNSSIPKANSMSESSFQLEEQRRLARTSLQRATKVSRLPSKYYQANLTETVSQTDICNDSTVNESDLLHTPKKASTPRTSLSLLKESLAQMSYKATDSNFSIDNLVSDFKNVFKQTDEQSSNLFTPADEACSMLLADELSWRQKNEMPVQEEQFSTLNNTGKESIGSFFQKGSNTLSDFPCESPNITREPIALIEPSFSLIGRDLSQQDNEKKSLSISAIQKFLSSEDTPKRTVYNLCKFTSEPDKNVNSENISFSLPVSKDSSYNSDHSENEAMKLICNKENVNSLNTNTSPSSRTSSRASSALTSLPNGKLPIETSKCDLIWGCVKLGKSVTQEFMIRNKSAKRLGLQLTLCSQEFKLRKDNRNDSQPLGSNKIILHPHESKSVIVSFIPTQIGAAIDELYFTSLDSNINQIKKQCVRLFGYGGSLKVDFRNLTRDTTGKFWLSLGKLDDRSIITSQFYVKNKGDVPVFIHISINSLETSKLDVNPHFFTLLPQEEKEIVVSYKPSNNDYNFLHKSLHSTMVVDLGGLNIIFGAEVERGRIRKICEKCNETGLKISQIANTLKEKIERECMPVDLVKFKEPPGHLQEIINLLTHYQIVLTLERDPEQTIIQQYPDESALYQSLYQDTTVVCNQSGNQHSCYVAPTILVLTIPYKHKDTIFLQSNNQNKLNFIASCQENDLELKPREGILDSYGTVTISVKYISTSVTAKKDFKIVIIVENEIFEVEVKVEFLGSAKNKTKSVLNCMI